MKRSGRKSLSQTKSPLKEQIKGSKTNPKGSASSKSKASKITLSEKIMDILKKKKEKYNKSHTKDVDTNSLKAVMRRGMGAYSTSHRPGMTRQGWGFARVNKFLLKKGGAKVKAAYVQDDDLLEKGGEIELLKVGQILHLRRLPMYYRSGDVGQQREVNKKVIEVISKETRFDEDEPNENNRLKTFYWFRANDKKLYNATFWGEYLIAVSSDNARYEAIDNPTMEKGGESKVYKGYSINNDGNYIKNDELLKKGGKTKGGDCYVKAGSFCLSPTSYNFIGKPYLVHSEVRGQGNLEGLRYGHAWVEDDKNVYDFSNDREIIMPKEIYYLLGDIKTDNPKKYQRYTFNEARDKMLETQNYGSWDIQTDYKKGGEMNILTQIYIPPTLQTISKEHRVDMDFLNEQYEIGTKEELEHTPDTELAQAIVLHHLNENPEYYIILKKAFEEQEAKKLDGYYAKGGAISCEQLDENGERKIDMDSVNILTNCVMSLPQTKSMHFDYETNKYTQERNRLHKDIIYNIKKDVVCINDDQPIAILMGGSPASGKSTFLKKYSPYLLNEEILKIDADDIRSKLPEYKGYNATQTHLETKDIVNTLLSDRNIGLPCKFDVIYDGTMNSTKSYMPLITLLKDLGYKVFIIYIDKVKKDVIVKRALERYKKSGRFVPLEVIDDFFDKGSSAMEQLKFMVDGYMIVDGGNTDYKIISQGGIRLPKKRNYSKIGQPIQITENDIITEFKKGGELNPDNPTIKDEITHKSGSAGGMLVGNRHSEGGIKAINKSTNSPLEMEGGEVVITRNAVSDDKKREFEGEMLTNRQILSKINEGGGGVSFANGGDVPQYIMTSGKEYKYGGKTMKDSEIVSSCGCQHKMKEGGYMDDGISNHEFMYLKYGHKLQREGDLLIMNKVVPSYLSFSKYNQSLQQSQLKETYKGLLNREYEINFDELPHAIKGALMIGNQKMIDNYINQ